MQDCSWSFSDPSSPLAGRSREQAWETRGEQLRTAPGKSSQPELSGAGFDKLSQSCRQNQLASGAGCVPRCSWRRQWQYWALGFSRPRRKGAALKNLAGALHPEAVRCILTSCPGSENGNSG